ELSIFNLHRASGWPLLVALLLLATICPTIADTQTNSPSPGSNRYLLVVEASRSMQKRVDGMLQSVQDLLVSKMGGQLKHGDTAGLWTYNEELSAGKVPVQRWSSEAQQTIAGRILTFLKAQKYEKRGRFEKVLPPLMHVVKSSDVLTVILISDGTEEVHG